jgi:hypothetical protein
MCVGDLLGTAMAPCASGFKYVGSGCGVALLFVFGMIGVDAKADWPIMLIVLACLVGLIWFIVVYCCFVCD